MATFTDHRGDFFNHLLSLMVAYFGLIRIFLTTDGHGFTRMSFEFFAS
jgi:hypothetical protein